MVGSHITVKKEWRQGEEGDLVKRLLMALIIEHLLKSKCEALVGTIHEDGDLLKISHDFGARNLFTEAEGKSGRIDLLVWDKFEVKELASTLPLNQNAIEVYERSVNFSTNTSRRDEKEFFRSKADATLRQG